MHRVRAYFFVCAGFLSLAAALLPSSAGAQPPAYLTQWGMDVGSCAYSVAIDGSGKVYVANGCPGFIEVYTTSGTYLTEIGTPGQGGDGQLANPAGVAVDAGGNVYVADTYSHRIQVFASDGTFIRKWGSYGVGNGQFDQPGGVAVDAGGNVYVADSGNNRIQVFTNSGTYLTQWGLTGFPVGVTVDATGNVYVGGPYDIRKFTGDGTLLAQRGTGAFGVAVDGSGNVYASDGYNDRVEKLTSNLTYVTEWGSSGEGDGQFYRPWGVAVDASGNVYVADQGNHRIQVFGSLPVPAQSTSWGRVKALYR